MIVLTPLRKFEVPVEAACISPDLFQGKNTAEIAKLALNRREQAITLCDLFKIEETPAATPT